MYDEIGESLENISEMSEAMDISLIFLKDISKDVKQIKVQIDNLQGSIDQLGEDVRKLRGKNYKELLEIRKQKILFQSKLIEVDSVYIQLKTIEYDPITGDKILYGGKESTFLMMNQWDDLRGEVNEFIWKEELLKNKDQQVQQVQIENQQQNEFKDVLLISGFAGSGKSKAARKIEEFLWQQVGINSKWIPIFVSLPTLKNPKYNLFEQALENEQYQFDKYQIRELKEDIQNGKEKIILILDSYDEMKQDCIQQNLLKTNKLFQELNIDKSNLQMKVITTTRQEILNTVGYQTWFYGHSIQTLKQVQLQNFDKEQTTEYLNQYVELSVKRKVKEIYEFVKNIKGQKFNLEEFLMIWSLIQQQVKNSIKQSEITKQNGIFQNKEEKFIIQKIKSHKILEVLSEEQVTLLQKELLALWNVNQYKESIKSVKIQDLLTTPFMLEIVVQVLPNLTKKYKGTTLIKDIFKQNFIKLKKQQRISQSKREQYEKEYLKSSKNSKQISNKDGYISTNQTDEQQISKIDNVELNQVLEQLDKENFFEKYTIISQLKYDDNFIYFDEHKIQLQTEHIKSIVTSLQLKKLTIFEFYESFVNFYHEQQIQKQRELGKVSNYENLEFDMIQFSSSLAIDMSMRELSQVAYKPQGKLDLKNNYKIQQSVDDWMKQYFDFEDEYKKQIRSCILLSTKGSTYSFTHKSIQEFYLAKYIFDLITSLKDFNLISPEQENDDLKNSIFNNPILNISTDNFKNVINFVKEKLISNKIIIQKLIDMVKLSKSQNFRRSASNSIYLLRQMNVYLGSQDFNKIQLDNTIISGLSLFDCDLSRSKFHNVEINSCNLNFANLSYAQWSNIKCKEMPSLKGHKQKILSIQFSPNGHYIASAGEEYEIQLWNNKTYQHIIPLKGHTDSVNTLSFSSDSCTLFSGSNDCTIRKWDLVNLNTENNSKSEVIQKLNESVLKVQITKDSKRLYIQDKSGLQVLNLQKDDLTLTENLVFQSEQSKLINFALNPIEPIVAILFQKNEIKFIDYSTKKELKSIKVQPVINMIFNKDGKFFAALGRTYAEVWDITQNRYAIIDQFSLPFTSTIQSIELDSSSKYLMITTQFFQFQREIIQKRIQSKEKKERCFEILISLNGKFTAVVQEKKLVIKEFLTEQVQIILPFKFQPSSIRFSDDSSKLAYYLIEHGDIEHFQILELNEFKIIYDLPWKKHQWQNLMISKNFNKLIVNFQILENQVNQMEGSLIIKINKIQQEPKIRQFSFNMEKFCSKAYSWVIAYTNLQADQIVIFDLEKNEIISGPLENEKKQILSFQFSPIKNEIAVGYREEVVIWNFESKLFVLENQIKLENLDIQSIQYSTNGAKIGLIFKDSFQIYDIDKKSIQLEEKVIIKKVAFSEDNQLIGFIDNNQQVNIQDLNQDYNNKTLKFDYQIQLKFNSDTMIIGGNNQLTLLSLKTYEIKTKQQTYVKFENIAFSHTSNIIALNKNRVLELWKLSEDKFEFFGSQLFDLPIKQIDFLNDGQNIIILLQNLELILCELNYIQFNQIFEESFTCAAFSSLDQIALAQQHGKIKIFNFQLQDIESSFTLELDYVEINHLEFFEKKSNFLLAMSQCKIFILNIMDNKTYNIGYIYPQVYSKLCLNEQKIISQISHTTMIWDIEDFQNIKLCGFYEHIYSISINENQNQAVGIRNHEEIKILNIFNVKFALPLISDGVIRSVILSNDKQLCLATSCKLYLRKVDKSQTIQLWHKVSEFAYCQKIQKIALVQEDEKILLTELENDKLNVKFIFEPRIFFAKNFSVMSCSFSQDGKKFLLVCDKIMALFSTKSGEKLVLKVVHIANHYTSILMEALFFESKANPNNLNNLALLYSNKFKIISAKSFRTLLQLKIDCETPFELSLDENIIYTPSINSLFVLSFNEFKLEIREEEINCRRIKCLKIIDNDTFIYLSFQNKIIQCKKSDDYSYSQINIPIDNIIGLDFVNQKQLLAIITNKNNIIFYDFKEKKKVGFLKGDQIQITSTAISKNGNIFAISSDDLLIRLWNIKQNESQEMMHAHQYSISALTISQDGQIAASGSIKGLEDEVPIFLWDLTNKKLITLLLGHQDSVSCIEFSQCQQQLISASNNGTIIIWNIEYPKAITRLYYIDQASHSLSSIIIYPKNDIFVSLNSFYYIQQLRIEQIKKCETRRAIYIKDALIYQSNYQPYNFINVDQFFYVSKQNQLVSYNIETAKLDIIVSIIQEQQTQSKIQVQQIIISNESIKHLICKQQLRSLEKDIVIDFYKDKFLIFTPNNQFLFEILDVKVPQSTHSRIVIHEVQKLDFLWRQTKIRSYNSYYCCIINNVIIEIQPEQIKLTKYSDVYEQQNSKNLYLNNSNPKNLQISDDFKYLAFNQEFENNILLKEISNPDNIIQLINLDEDLIAFQFQNDDSNKISALYSNRILRNWKVNNQSSEKIEISFDLTEYKYFIFSDKLKYIVCRNETNKIDVWEIINSQKYYEISFNNDQRIANSKIEGLAVSRNEEKLMLAVVKEDCIILKNDIKQSQIDYIDHDFKKSHISFTNNDQELICCVVNLIYLWKIEESLEYSLIGYWQIEFPIDSFYYDFVNQKIITFVIYKVLNWTLSETKLNQTIHKLIIDKFENINKQKSVCFSPNSKYFCHLSPFLRIYEMDTFKLLNESKDLQGQLMQFQSNEVLVIANNNELLFITITQIKNLVLQNRIKYKYQIFDFIVCSDYQLIQFEEKIDQGKIIDLYENNENVQEYLTSIYKNDDSPLATFYSGENPVFTKCGKYLAFKRLNQIQIISVQHLNLKKQLFLDKKYNFGKIFYSPNGESIFLFTNQSMLILNPHTLETRKKQELDFQVNEVQISLNWNYVALMSSYFVKIFFFQNQEEIKLQETIEENEYQIICIALSPKGGFLLTGYQDKKDFKSFISLWKWEDKKKLSINNQLTSKVQILRFCPDGINFVAGLSDGSVNLYSIDSRQLKLNQQPDQYKILLYQTFTQQSLFQAQECKIQEATIKSEEESIIELFIQKGSQLKY